MTDIKSKVTGEILHKIFRHDDFEDGRIDLIDPNEFIQCAALVMHKGKTFRPHRHNVSNVLENDKIAQESWHILKGSVEVTFYDLDDTVLHVDILKRGDTSFTLRGGHNYRVLSNKAKVLEYKTGRYYGQKDDKTLI
jgi:hypothetical protein